VDVEVDERRFGHGESIVLPVGDDIPKAPIVTLGREGGGPGERRSFTGVDGIRLPV
jgi:hypothetical protein